MPTSLSKILFYIDDNLKTKNNQIKQLKLACVVDIKLFFYGLILL